MEQEKILSAKGSNVITQADIAVYMYDEDTSAFTPLGYLQTIYNSPNVEFFNCPIITDKINIKTKWKITGMHTDSMEIMVDNHENWGGLGYEVVNIPHRQVVVMREVLLWSKWQFVEDDKGQQRRLQISSVAGRGYRIHGSRAQGRYLLLGKAYMPGIRELYFAIEQEH